MRTPAVWCLAFASLAVALALPNGVAVTEHNASEALQELQAAKAEPQTSLLSKSLRSTWKHSQGRCEGYDPASRVRTHWDASLDAFVQAAKRCARPTAGGPTVALTVSNMGYADRFDELVNELVKFAGMQLVVVALDSETDEYFAERGIPTIIHDLVERGLPKHKQPGWGLPELVMRSKYEVTWALLKADLRVMFMEMDVFLAKDPLVFDADPEVDFYAGNHRYSPELNIGFFIAKPRPAMLHVFENLCRWVNRQDREDERVGCEPFDQKLMDCAIRGPKMDWADISKTCGFSEGEVSRIYDAGSEALKWKALPNDQLVHWEFKPSDYPKMVVGHIWMNKPKESLDAAKNLGLWQGGTGGSFAAADLKLRSWLRSSMTPYDNE